MGKIYIFGIGGTGARVIKSLSLLLASGVTIDADEVVPVFIDPDDAAADLTRTVHILRTYNAIRERLNTRVPNGFFRTKITEFVPNFRLPLRNTRDMKFKEYMGVNRLSDANKALVHMLFSEDNLESSMQIGFKGNPNIGSVVLNQFADSPEFISFANSFQEGDRIFIISSIFGGTGASGFPLLLKTLRGGRQHANWGLISKAPIGAISVLPYFRVKPDPESSIDSATFISKTKSALAYYDRTISGTNSVDTLYYIADGDNGKAYDNCEGGAGQQNRAHFIELASALAIIDFVKTPASERTIHKEFGIEEDVHRITFRALGRQSRDLLQRPLTRFLLFAKYLNERHFDTYLAQPWAKSRKLDASFWKAGFVDDIRAVQADYIQWLDEMSGNERRFAPFETNKEKDIYEMLQGEGLPKRTRFNDYVLFDDRLNKQKRRKDATREQSFTELFQAATDDLITDKYNF
ncbi:MAG: hypothetical protein LBM61_02030 [Prevotellaceae bacterium]|jgi:hypothetical protein|nr:hypothetical protein [Prevotellaceae bacterium]